jgi:Phage tail protein.
MDGVGVPEYRVSDVPRPQDHGLYAGSDYLSGRAVTLRVSIHGDTPADVVRLVDALLAEWQSPQPPAPTAAKPLTFRPHGGPDRRLAGRPRRAAVSARVVGCRVEAVLEYFAPDPRVYDDAETVLTVAAATSGGGRTYNRTYNLTYAAGGAGGNLAAVNAGNFPTRPVLKVTGPCDTPKVENVEAGRFLQADLALAAGEFLVLDTDARTVLLGGTASRYSSLIPGSSWWELPPGTSTVKFTSADSQGTLEVRYRSAYL